MSRQEYEDGFIESIYGIKNAFMEDSKEEIFQFLMGARSRLNSAIGSYEDDLKGTNECQSTHSNIYYMITQYIHKVKCFLSITSFSTPHFMGRYLIAMNNPLNQHNQRLDPFFNPF